MRRLWQRGIRQLKLETVENQGAMQPEAPEAIPDDPARAGAPSAAAIEAEVSLLATRWREGNRVDPTLRAFCNLRLAALREVWRARPEMFAPAWVAVLKEISQGLKGGLDVRSDQPGDGRLGSARRKRTQHQQRAGRAASAAMARPDRLSAVTVGQAAMEAAGPPP